MTGQQWYRGPAFDWVRATVISLMVGIGAAYHSRIRPSASQSSELSTLWTGISWQAIAFDGLLHGAVLTPVVLLAIRWYYAGEPLPDSIENRPYKVYLLGAVALQTIGGITAYAFWIGSYVLGTPIEGLLTGLPEGVIMSLFPILLLGLTVGVIGPIVFMYLDARHLEDRRLLDATSGDGALPLITIMGVQFAGIPTLLATWYYLSKRDRATEDIDLYGWDDA